MAMDRFFRSRRGSSLVGDGDDDDGSDDRRGSVGPDAAPASSSSSLSSAETSEAAGDGGGSGGAAAAALEFAPAAEAAERAESACSAGFSSGGGGNDEAVAAAALDAEAGRGRRRRSSLLGRMAAGARGASAVRAPTSRHRQRQPQPQQRRPSLGQAPPSTAETPLRRQQPRRPRSGPHIPPEEASIRNAAIAAAASVESPADDGRLTARLLSNAVESFRGGRYAAAARRFRGVIDIRTALLDDEAGGGGGDGDGDAEVLEARRYLREIERIERSDDVRSRHSALSDFSSFRRLAREAGAAKQEEPDQRRRRQQQQSTSSSSSTTSAAQSAWQVYFDTQFVHEAPPAPHDAARRRASGSSTSTASEEESLAPERAVAAAAASSDDSAEFDRVFVRGDEEGRERAPSPESGAGESSYQGRASVTTLRRVSVISVVSEPEDGRSAFPSDRRPATERDDDGGGIAAAADASPSLPPLTPATTQTAGYPTDEGGDVRASGGGGGSAERDENERERGGGAGERARDDGGDDDGGAAAAAEAPAWTSTGTFTADASAGSPGWISADPYEAGLRRLSAGRADLARPLFLASLRERIDSLGMEHVLVSTVLERLGDVSAELGQTEEGQVYYSLALRILKSFAREGGGRGEGDRRRNAASRGTLYVKLGDLYRDAGRHSRAVKLYEKSLRMRVGLHRDDGIDDKDSDEQTDHRHHGDVVESAQRAIAAHEALASAAMQMDDQGMASFHLSEMLWLSRYEPKGSERMESSLPRGDKEIARLVSRHGFLHMAAKTGRQWEDGFLYEEECRRLLLLAEGEAPAERIRSILDAAASIHLRRNEAECALRCYEEKLRLIGDSPPKEDGDALVDTLFQLGCTCANLGEHDNGIGYLDKALGIKVALSGDDNDVVRMLHRALGSAHLAAGNSSGALGHFEAYARAACREDHKVDALNTMGIIHAQTEQVEDAFACYIQAAKVEFECSNGDGPVQLFYNMKEMFLCPRKFPGVSNLYESALDFRDMKAILIHAGLAQLRQRHASQHASGCIRDVVAHLNHFAGIDAGKADAASHVLKSMGNMLFRRCRYREAIDFYERYLSDCGYSEQLDPSQEEQELLTNLATAYFKIGARERSMQLSYKVMKEMKRATKGGSENDIEPLGPKVGVLNFPASSPHTFITRTTNTAEVQGDVPNAQSNTEGVLRDSHFAGVQLCLEGEFDRALGIFDDILHKRKDFTLGVNRWSAVKTYLDISIVNLLKGDTDGSRSALIAAMEHVREANVPMNHPVVGQLRRLHGWHNQTPASTNEFGYSMTHGAI